MNPLCPPLVPELIRSNMLVPSSIMMKSVKYIKEGQSDALVASSKHDKLSTCLLVIF